MAIAKPGEKGDLKGGWRKENDIKGKKGEKNGDGWEKKVNKHEKCFSGIKIKGDARNGAEAQEEKRVTQDNGGGERGEERYWDSLLRERSLKWLWMKESGDLLVGCKQSSGQREKQGN